VQDKRWMEAVNSAQELTRSVFCCFIKTIIRPFKISKYRTVLGPVWMNYEYLAMAKK
jgi:hypothetical protein